MAIISKDNLYIKALSIDDDGTAFCKIYDSEKDRLLEKENSGKIDEFIQILNNTLSEKYDKLCKKASEYIEVVPMSVEEEEEFLSQHPDVKVLHEKYHSLNYEIYQVVSLYRENHTKEFPNVPEVLSIANSLGYDREFLEVNLPKKGISIGFHLDVKSKPENLSELYSEIKKQQQYGGRDA